MICCAWGACHIHTDINTWQGHTSIQRTSITSRISLSDTKIQLGVHMNSYLHHNTPTHCFVLFLRFLPCVCAMPMCTGSDCLYYILRADLLFCSLSLACSLGVLCFFIVLLCWYRSFYWMRVQFIIYPHSYPYFTYFNLPGGFKVCRCTPQSEKRNILFANIPRHPRPISKRFLKLNCLFIYCLLHLGDIIMIHVLELPFP